MKYYAVHIGKTKGVFTTWDECKASVDKFPNAKFKSFESRTEAEYFVKHGVAKKTTSLNKENKKDYKTILDNKHEATAYVDGSYNVKKDVYGSGTLFIFNGKITNLVSSGNKPEHKTARNVAGEIYAVLNAIDYAKSNNVSILNIFYDYEGIEQWASGKWKANSPISIFYVTELLKTKIKLSFHKVKAHSNDTLNDCADLLAKKASGIEQKPICKPNEKYKKI